MSTYTKRNTAGNTERCHYVKISKHNGTYMPAKNQTQLLMALREENSEAQIYLPRQVHKGAIVFLNTQCLQGIKLFFSVSSTNSSNRNSEGEYKTTEV